MLIFFLVSRKKQAPRVFSLGHKFLLHLPPSLCLLNRLISCYVWEELQLKCGILERF
jgi:hypothetical protein